MPTIKKIFFKKISAVLALFIVCGFSLTLGAILLRVVYSAVFQQPNSLPTADPHELGALAEKIGNPGDAAGANTVFGKIAGAGGVAWAGYSAFTNGNTGGIIGANQKCNTAFTGSHVCAYDEILKLGSNYPNTESTWVIDGSYLSGDGGSTLVYQYTRDGYSYEGGSTTVYFGMCRGWTNGFSGQRGPYLNAGGTTLGLVTCDVSIRLPCCK